MRHATEGTLRRFGDEPFAIPDRSIDHIESCPRCQARMSAVANDVERCAGLFSDATVLQSATSTSTTTATLAPDIDAAWVRFRRESQWHSEAGARHLGSRRDPVRVPKRRPRLFDISLRGGIIVGAVGVVLAGTAAATTITTVFAPTHVAPLPLDRGDLHSLADFMGLGDSQVLGGFQTPAGSLTTRFGTIDWSSSGTAQSVRTLGDASREAGFDVKLPAEVPSGVGEPQEFVVQPSVKVTATFDPSVEEVGGSSIVLSAGPAVLVEYGSSTGVGALFGSASKAANGGQTSTNGRASQAIGNGGQASSDGQQTSGNRLDGLPTLGILTMPRPTAVSSGATTSQIEDYLLSQPGVPPALAEEIRLLGDAGTTLPVPVPADATVRSVQIAGSPGVLVSDASNAVSGVVWEDGSGMLHLVAGLVDQQDVLNVANQLG